MSRSTNHPYLIMAFSVFVAGIFVITCALPAVAGDWKGTDEVLDGVRVIGNPAEPMEPVIESTPKELWRIGGDTDDEDEFFGVISQILSDDAGNVYLLDSQLNEIKVFTPDGEYLRSLGREGEGPGEFRRPSDLFLAPDGNVAVMQRMPGKIVLLSTEGDPVGNYPLPETDGMRMFFGGRRAGDDVVLSAATMKRKEAGMDFISSLIRIDATGKETVKYTEREDSRSFNTMESDEKTFGRNGQTWTTDFEGRVYTSDDFDNYSINVWGTDGTLERVIEREYDHRMRSKEEKERATPRVRMRGRHGRGGEMKFKMSDWDRDIQRIYPRDDGTLWVLSSHGAFDAKDGTIGTFDIFDAEGRFTNQITLKGDGDFYNDGFHFVGDRLFVVKGFRTAAEAMMGGREGEEEEAEEEPEPMSVICYGLDMIVQGSN